MSKSKKSLTKLNETGKRKSADRRNDDAPESSATPNDERRVKRRRQIDPTTCEREYSDPEVDFMRAMDEYKRASGRMFPTCSEILEVLTNLGYRQIADAQPVYDPNAQQDNESADESEEQFA